MRLVGPLTWLAQRQAQAAVARLRCGRLSLALPDGTLVHGGLPDATLRGTLRVNRRRLFRRVALSGRMALGDAYVDGDWDADDLEAVLEIGVRNGAASGGRLWARLAGLFARRRPRNDRARARRHIQAHYDLGNDFFALWLDPTLTYSSAQFARDDEDLETAQRRKLARMADLADLRPGQHVLEIGCGWGSFALHAAAERGCRVTALTLSAAQREEAQRRVRAQGLADRVEIRLEDWRDVRGRFDRIVSIEMLEAIGERLWPTWFERLDALLVPGGRAALQVICHPDPGFEAYARSTDWIERRVFPGCLLGNRSAFARLLEQRTRLRVTQAYDLAPDYALTLTRWRRTFLARRAEVRALGLSERFVRTWDYYLAVCAATFRARALEDWQLVLARPGEAPDAREASPA